jgi:hypothetical protein
MSQQPHLVTVDINGELPLDGNHHIAAWVFPPSTNTTGPVPVLWCLPGGSFTKAYWHLEVPGMPDYSFARHFADQGMLVLAADHINTGDSSRHPRAADLLPHVVAQANAVAYSRLIDRVSKGTLLPDLGPINVGARIGVGHSMGAMLTIIQQSRHHSFDAIAPLGYGNAGPIISITGADTSYRASLEDVVQLAETGALDNPIHLDRCDPQIRAHFYHHVPDAVMTVDDLSITGLPGVTGALSIVPFIVADHASRVRCPVFIGLGERDSTPSHYDEVKAYRSSHDVTLFILEGSAHCHNTANTRHQLWNRLAGWVRGLPVGVHDDGP